MIKTGKQRAYHNIHHWIRYNFGSANHCSNKECTKVSVQYQWALKRNKSHTKEIKNYLQLCKTCHVSYDSNRNKALINKHYKNYDKPMTEKRHNIRVSTQALKRLRIASAKRGISIIELIDEISK